MLHSIVACGYSDPHKKTSVIVDGLNGIYFSKYLITNSYFLISLAEQNSTERMVNVSPLKNIMNTKNLI